MESPNILTISENRLNELVPIGQLGIISFFISIFLEINMYGLAKIMLSVNIY